MSVAQSWLQCRQPFHEAEYGKEGQLVSDGGDFYGSIMQVGWGAWSVTALPLVTASSLAGGTLCSSGKSWVPELLV